jgi:hypothetical protein
MYCTWSRDASGNTTGDQPDGKIVTAAYGYN